MLLTACGSSKKAAEDTKALEQVIKKQEVKPYDGVERFTSDLDVDVNTGSDKVSLDGTVAMKRGTVMRISLSYMGFIQVGVVEFTPSDVLIVNRIEHQYTRVDYATMNSLQNNKLSFESMETMAWENIYDPDGTKTGNNALGTMLADLINKNLKNGKQVKINIKVGKPNTKKDVESTTTLSSRYTEVPAAELIARLMSVAK